MLHPTSFPSGVHDAPTVEDCNTRPGAYRAMPETAAFDFPTPEDEAAMESQYRARLATLPDWLDVPCQECGTAIHVQPGSPALCTACVRSTEDDGPDDAPPAGAMFPEVATWSDQQLIVAVELADAREPGLNLHAVGNLPDRHDAFLHECSAELVRRLEARGIRLAA